MRRLVLFTLLLPLLAACSNPLKEKLESEVQRPDTGLFLGAVVAVNADHHFVIVDATNAYAIPAGGRAKLRRDNREVGEIEFEKERSGQFAAARIIKGEPAKGDEVYYYR